MFAGARVLDFLLHSYALYIEHNVLTQISGNIQVHTYRFRVMKGEYSYLATCFGLDRLNIASFRNPQDVLRYHVIRHGIWQWGNYNICYQKGIQKIKKP